MVRSEAPSPDRTVDPAYNWDLCRKALKESQLQCTDGNAQLCEYCFKQFNALPQGKIRQCLERFMLGNVV